MARTKKAGKVHRCHARGCKNLVKIKMLFCAYHWRLVPTKLQLELSEHYTSGVPKEEQTKRWMIIVRKIQLDLAALERR